MKKNIFQLKCVPRSVESTWKYLIYILFLKYVYNVLPQIPDKELMGFHQI